MSRIGKKSIPVPDSAQVSVEGQKVIVKGPKGSLEVTVHPDLKVIQENGQLQVTPLKSDQKFVKAMHGTTRAILKNMVIGVTEGFKKELEIIGVGYSATMEGNLLKLTLGYSHDIYFESPKGIEIQANKDQLMVSGVGKELVGQIAAKIRSLRPPEPYKGKGIRYKGELIRIKKGKTVGG